MANNLGSNTVEDLARIFLEHMESTRVLTKTVDTQLLQGRYTPRTGGTVSFKRPHDYNTIETVGGDISASNKSDIISGKATGVVQNFLTQAVEWEIIEEALELDQLDKIIAPMARRSITSLEVKLGTFMQKNGGFAVGTPGTGVTTWSDVSRAQAEMEARGVPTDADWMYVMSPFTSNILADVQNSLSSGSARLVDDSWERAQVTDRLAGMKVMKSNALKTFTSGASADRTGSLSATPDATYVTAKDTMTQVLAVENFTTAGTILAGDVIEIDDNSRFQLNLDTRETMIDSTGAALKWRAVVTEDVTLVAGAGNITVTGPAIRETDGQYNTVSSALASGDVVTLLGATAELRQPNLIYHPQAFGLGTVKLPKLFATDTVATTEDGFSIRVSKYSDGDANVQKVRFDLLPAFIVFNPFLGGQAWG